jgi:hypothetical protein
MRHETNRDEVDADLSSHGSGRISLGQTVEMGRDD